jgi:CelD/BcsL family acetyltransferase involved in cellulose biosynthesis
VGYNVHRADAACGATAPNLIVIAGIPRCTEDTMRLQHYRDISGFEALQSDWNRLVQSSSANTVFSTWEWQKTWWEYLGAGDLWLTAVYADDGQLIAIFPCYLYLTEKGERSLRLVGCIEVADYLDLIIERGYEEDALSAFTSSLLEAGAPAWDSVELCNLPDDSPTLRYLPDLARAAGLQATSLEEDVCPIIELPADWETYLLSINKKQRHEIRRKLRRAEAETELEWYVVGESHDLRSEMDIFLDLHQKSRPDKDHFMGAEMQSFFRAIAETMRAAGWLQLIQLKLDGRHEASLLSFDYGNTIMLYNSGFDPEGNSRLSPGNVLVAIGIRYAIELGRAVFDFLQGDEEYKYRFGAQDTHVYRVLISRGS